MLTKTPEETRKYLAGWVNTVSKGLKAERVIVFLEDSVESAVTLTLASGIDLPLLVVNASVARMPLVTKIKEDRGADKETSILEIAEFNEREVDSDTSIILGSEHKDKLILKRDALRSGGPLADLFPLGGLHNSEVQELARGLGLSVIEKNDYEDAEKITRLAMALCGEAKGDAILHLASVFEKLDIESVEFRDKLKALGQREIMTRYRHNPNIPFPNVQQSGFTS